jgi:radical SAM protein with 4Fe4S-binding SPASM domain
LEKDFIKCFDNLSISIPLSRKEDHDNKRISNKESSYSKILDNLMDCKSIFYSNKYNLNIRYNVDESNINKFDKFLTYLNSKELTFSIETAYTYEHEYNKYRNLLSFNDFKIWNSTEAIEIILKHDLRVKQKPNIMITPCMAYTGYNIKVYSDGSVGLCNADYKRKVVDLDDIQYYPGRLKTYYYEKRRRINIEECFSCRERLLCGGILFCRRKYCDYSEVNLSDFLKTYIDNLMQAKQFDFTERRNNNASNKKPNNKNN